MRKLNESKYQIGEKQVVSCAPQKKLTIAAISLAFGLAAGVVSYKMIDNDDSEESKNIAISALIGAGSAIVAVIVSSPIYDCIKNRSKSKHKHRIEQPIPSTETSRV